MQPARDLQDLHSEEGALRRDLLGVEPYIVPGDEQLYGRLGVASQLGRAVSAPAEHAASPQLASSSEALQQAQPATSQPATDAERATKSTRSSRGRPPESSDKAVGPWVVSNRKVQKRYRERQKAEKVTMEQQLADLTAQLQTMKAQNIELSGHNSTLERAVVFKDHEVAKLQECNNAMDTAARPADLQTPSSDQAEKSQSVTSQASQNVIQAYKGIVKGMVGLMLKLSHEGPSPVLMQELDAASNSLIALFMRTFIFSAHEGARLMKANLEHDHYQAGAMISAHDDPKRFWQSVTDRLELQPEQRQEMTNLREHFLQSLTECHEAREAICLGLQKGTQKIQTAYTTLGTDAQAYVASMLEVHHESRQLRENLRKQHRIWMDFYATIFRLWDARQNCCAAVHSFPRFPDILAISSCVAITDSASSDGSQPAGDKSFRTHKLEMKRSPKFMHRLLENS